MINIKHLTLFISALGISTANASIFFSGLYGGIGAGGVLMSGKHDYTSENGGQGQAKYSTYGGIGSLHFGYVTEVKNSGTMLGGETYYIKGFSTVSKPLKVDGATQTDGRLHIKHTQSFGAAAIMGMLINPKIMVYGKLAYDLASVDYKYTDLTFGNAREKKYTKKSNIIIPFAGFKYAMTNSFHIGAEYGIAIFDKVNIRKNELIDGARVELCNKMTEHRLLITLTYQITAPKVAG